MKLSAIENLKRETFVAQLFRKNPSLSVRKAQIAIVVEFGQEMRPKKVLLIRRDVTVGNHKSKRKS